MPFRIARIFPTAIFGRRHGREKYSVSGLITFDIINYTFMALDALMGYDSPAEEDADSEISDGHSVSSTQDLASLITLLQGARDNIRAAIQHRMNKPENDRLPDILYWKGIQYEMVLPRIFYLTTVC